MRTWPVLTALLLSACNAGVDDSRGEGGTALSQPQTGTDPGTTGQATDPPTGSTTTTPPPTTTANSDTGSDADTGTTMMASASSTGGSTTGGSSDDSGGPKLDLPVPESMPIPVHDIPGLQSITFYETTGQVTEYTFTIDGPELNNQLPDPLSQANRDIQGTGVEFYDVYYSEEDGTFNPDGSYLTIAGSFGAKLPAGGGLNLAEISLNYDDNSVEFGSFLASFLGLGDNYAPGSEPNAIDGKLETHTTMGNNVDEPNKRLRVTLGFKSSLMPG